MAEGFHGAVFALGLTKSKEAAAVGVPQGGDQVIHADVDQAGLGDEAGDGAHALADDFIGEFKGFLDAFFRDDQFAHAVVFKGDRALAYLRRSCRARLAWLLRRRPSKANGRVAKTTTKAPASRAMRAITGAAPEPVPPPRPTQRKTMFRPASSCADFLLGGQRGFGSQLRIAAAAEALGEGSCPAAVWCWPWRYSGRGHRSSG